MVLLVTSDNEQFNADKDVVERSVLIKNMLEGECRLLSLWPSSSTTLIYRILDVGESDQPIPLPNVSSSVLKKVSFSSAGIWNVTDSFPLGSRVLRTPSRRAFAVSGRRPEPRWDTQADNGHQRMGPKVYHGRSRDALWDHSCGQLPWYQISSVHLSRCWRKPL